MAPRFPGFTDEENSLGQFVFNVAREEFQEEPSHFENKMVAGEKRLENLVSTFEAARNAKILFQGNFKIWKKGRESNINNLREIAAKMQTEQFRCNVAKIIGAATSAVTGAASLVSAVSNPTAPVTAPLAVASAIGSALALTAAFAEVALVNERVQEAEVVLKTDKEIFKLMEHWFKRSEELANTVERIIGFQLLAEITADMKKMYADIRNKDSAEECEEEIKAVIREGVRKMCKSKNVTAEFGVECAPFVITYVFVRCLIKRENLHLFSCVLTSVRVAISGVFVADAFVDLAGVFAGGALRVGLLATGIALDIAAIALASYDIYKGSVSKQAAEISKAADELEKEFKVLEALHRSLSVVAL